MALLEENAEKAAEEAKKKKTPSDPGPARRLQAAKAEPKPPAQAKAPARGPRKPVIDEAVWQHPTHPIHHKISDAVDNHLHNII